MSKNQQAPGELELVRAFINTLDIEQDAERLSTPAALAAWLAEHGLASSGARASRAELGHAIKVREALREIVLAHSEGSPEPEGAWRTLDDAARRARLAATFENGTAVIEPGAGGVDGALGRLLAIVHRAVGEQGSWRRLKACRLHSCEWAFYDHTKNRSGAWCNMAVCGNRAKARTYRERRAGAGA